MNLKIKHFVIFITIGSVLSCQRQPPRLSEIAGKQIPIDSTLLIDDSVDAFIAPYRNRLNAVLDSTLAIAARPITKTDGDNNSGGQFNGRHHTHRGQSHFSNRAPDIPSILSY